MATALITGASKGIGKAIAFELASRKHDLLLTARSKDLLEKTAQAIRDQHQVQVSVLPSDLSSAEGVEAVANWAKEHPVSILVNNAGYANWGWFPRLPLEKQLNMMQLNMQSVVSLTHKLLPALKTRERAYILNVGSTTAYQALATMSAYAASKAFVLMFSRGLRVELKKTPISVTCLNPGPTDTHFMERAEMGAMAKTAEKFNMTPEKVAKIGVNAMFRKKAEVVPGFLNKIQAWAAGWMPKGMIEGTAAGIYLKKMDEKTPF